MANHPKTPTERLYAIAEQGLCIGCGVCQSVAGKENLCVTKTSNGYERPVVVGALDHEMVDKIYDICPGTRIDGLPSHAVDSASKLDNVWGVWHRMVLAYAADEQVRYEGSTGGVLSALASYLLESKKVDFILHAKASTIHPTFGEAHLSFTHEDVMAGAGSRYGPTAPLLAIDDILKRGQNFAFIGKPCDIAALRNYARHNQDVDRLVKYFLTPVCGGFFPPDKMDEFLRANEIEPHQVTEFRYRGKGCPGPTRIETQNMVKEFHYNDFWGEDETQWSLPFRCKICPDGIGESADIAAADSWAGGSPTREGSESDKGTNAVIARTAKGLELLEQAIKDGALQMDYDIPPDRMSYYQPHQMSKKYAVWARHQGLKEAGRIMPQTNGLRIKELADELPEADNAYQREGTVKRIQQGKADEPTPKII